MKIGRILAAILAATLLMVALTGTALAGGTVTATGGDSYVRTGPGLGFATLGVLHNGESAEYLDDTQYDWRGVAWYCIAFEDMGDGWVSSRYTELYEDGGSYWGLCVEATGRVNVRSGPGIGYEDMGTLIEGERIEYLNVTKYDSRGVAWYKALFYTNDVVWVSSQLSELVFGEPGGGDTGDATYSGIWVEATGDLNIRSGPGLGYQDKGTMGKGDVAEYLNDYEIDERGVVWYKVRFGTKIGWVSSRYSELY
jgi:uncharacterized protein YraI